MIKSKLKRIITMILCISVVFVSMPETVYANGNKLDSLKEKAGGLKDSALEKADKAKEAVGQFANTTKEGAIDAYNNASEYISGVITKIDTKKFQNGWDIASYALT